MVEKVMLHAWVFWFFACLGAWAGANDREARAVCGDRGAASGNRHARVLAWHECSHWWRGEGGGRREQKEDRCPKVWVGLMWPQRPTRRGGRKGRARSRKLFSWRASSWICTLRSNLRASQQRAQLGSKQWRVRGIEFFGAPGSQCDLLTSLRTVFEGVETRGASRPAGNVQKCVRAEAKWILGSGYVSMLPLGDVQLFPSGCRSRLFMKGDMRYDGVQAAKETELDGRSVASFAGFARLASLPTWLLS